MSLLKLFSRLSIDGPSFRTMIVVLSSLEPENSQQPGQ